MKNLMKIIFLVVLTVFLIKPSQSQQGWNFGLTGGLNLAWISQPTVTGTPVEGSFGKRLSFNAGLFAEYGFNRRLYLQMGLNFDQRGFTYKESDANSSTDLTVRAHYLEVPFLMRYAFIAKEKIDIYGLLGPSFGFLTGGRIVGTNTVNGVEGTIDNKISDTYNSTAFGIKIGLGFEIPIADDRGATFFDVRYNVGLGDNIKQGGYYEDTNIDATSQVLSFVVGVKGYIE
jgi:hypothetical protein